MLWKTLRNEGLSFEGAHLGIANVSDEAEAPLHEQTEA